MSSLFFAALYGAAAVTGVVVAFLGCGRAVRLREATQARLASRVSHLAPRHSWSVAYASHPHMEAVFKTRSWQEVGVLHLYEEAVAFFGEQGDFEVARDEVAAVQLTTYLRTNPLIPWVVIETTGGVRYYFCLPEGMHVFGMQARAEEVLASLQRWARGAAALPLRVT